MTHVSYIAIDPGYDRIGWAVGEITPKNTLVPLQFGCIITNRHLDIMGRYQEIIEQFDTLFTQYRPTECAIEAVYFATNTTTAIRVSEAKGIILGCALRHKVKISEYTPTEVKQSVTGDGKASKAAISKMVRLQLKFLPQQTIIDDAMDALAILLTHYASRKLVARRLINY